MTGGFILIGIICLMAAFFIALKGKKHMACTENLTPSIPDISPESIQNALEAIKETIEIREGLRGPAPTENAFVRLCDLTAAILAIPVYDGTSWTGATITVPDGGTGAVTLGDHGLLVGSGVGPVTVLGAATNGQLPIGSTGADPVIAALTGTASQVVVTNGAGSITLSTPQDIHTAASPTFEAMVLQGAAINTAANYTGLSGSWVKTAGATDQFDNLWGLNFTLSIDQAGGVIGGVKGIFGTAIITDATTVGGEVFGAQLKAEIDTGTIQGDVCGGYFWTQIDGGTLNEYAYGVYSNTLMAVATLDKDIFSGYLSLALNSGTLTGNAFGLCVDVDISAGMTSIGGSVYGAFIQIDDDQGVVGTVYGLYLNELTGVDYGIYQNGTANNYFGGNVGIGTSTIPHGGVGAAMLAIDGLNSSNSGPHIQVTTASDDYPLFQILNYAHDSVFLSFDMYFDGNWKSSDAGSNYTLRKSSDLLRIGSCYGVAAGSNVTLKYRLTISSTALIINESQMDSDFIVKSVNKASAIVLDANTDSLSIDTALLGFFAATPVNQPDAVADATGAGDVVARLNELIARNRELGLIAT